MNRKIAFALSTLLCFSIPACSRAQTTPDASGNSAVSIAKDFDKPLADLLHLPGWFTFDGQYRGRFEDDTAIKFVPNASDTYYLQRARLRLTIAPAKWLRMVAELQDTRNYLYGNRTLPSYSFDPIDLRQAYVELGNPEGTGFDLKVGRQDLKLGDGRMVTDFDWLNNGRYFDVIRSSYSPNSDYKIMRFAGSPVNNNNTPAFDEHLPGEHFYGVYTTAASLVPGMSIEPYYLLKTDFSEKGELKTGSAAIDALGLRLAGKAPYRINYSTEIVKEFGHYATDRVSAIAGAYVVGWTAAAGAWQPHFSAEYDHASGDRNPKDGVRQTFDSFYSGKIYFGVTDQIGWKNIRTERVGFDFTPAKRLKIRFDVRNHNLATTQDSLYTAGGASNILNRNATSTHVGVESDNSLDIALTARMNVKAGFVHIFPGEYLRQATKGSSYSSPYLMWTKLF